MNISTIFVKHLYLSRPTVKYMYLIFLAFVLQLSVMIGKGTSQRLAISCEAGRYSNGGVCTDCDRGKYKAGFNFATRCTDCTPGKYAAEDKAVGCEQCAAGFYSNSGNYGCSGCQRGYFQNKIGQSTCHKCKPGKYTNMRTSELCMHCPEGKYQNEEAQLLCRDCPRGWQQMAPGSSSCKDCQVGTYERRDDSSPPTCLNCNVGQYQNETAQQECKECPLGYTNVIEQSSFCRKCPTSVESRESLCHGWGLDNSTEYVACPPGKYSDGLSTCLDCQSGWISVQDKATEGYDSCQLCGSGTGVNVDQTLCVGCPAGLYSNNGICSVCRPGTFSNETGSSHCRACLAGTYFNGTVPINQTVTVCDSCPRGWSTDALTGAANCSRCSGASKSHVKQAQCTAICPASVSTSVVGSDNECDTCAVGHQLQGLQCASCPSGTYKDAAVPTCHQCPTGFVSAENRAVCERCELGKVPQNNTNCEHCVSGKYQNSILSCGDCPQGFSQSNNGTLLCDACAAGKHQNQSGQHSCDTCNSGQYQPTTSQSNCFSCPTGYVSTAGFATCLMCPRGYGSQNGACVGCVPGKGSLQEPLSGTCVECPPGKYSSNKVCTPCPTNTYQDVANKTSCQNCGANRYSAQGATFCSNCAAGNYSASDNSCVDCVSGQYRGVDDPENECITCPIGFKANIVGSLSGTVDCVLCPDGTEANGSSCTGCPIGFFGKAGVCVSCPAGYYQDNIGHGACIACETFKVSPAGSLSSDACQGCDTGLYTIVKNGLCDVCPHGNIYDGTTHVIGDCKSCPLGWEVATKTTCQECAKNEFSEQGTYCHSCPTGFSTRSAGSSQCAKCIDGDCDGVCPEGEYLSKDSCKYCPSGYVSLGGYQNKCFECTKGTYQHEPSKSRCLLCEAGRFSAIGANTHCHLCAKGQYQPEEGQSDCLGCMHGKYSELTGQNECKYCRLGQFTEIFGTSDSSECKQCPAGKMGIFGGHCVDCPESTWQNETGRSNCKMCSPDDFNVSYSKARSTNESDCFDIDGIVSYVFGMKDDGKREQTLDTSCEIRPNMVLYCPSCTCKSDVRDGYWAGPLCDECRRGFAGGQVGKCLIKCPGYDGVHDSTMCNGNGKCWYGKHGSGECLCGGKNILDSTSDNVVVSVKTCPAGQRCPGYGTDISPTTTYKPLYYLLEYRQYSVFVLQMNTHTPKRGHMWFERYSPQNIYENVCSTCVGKYDKTPYTEIGYFNSQNDYAKFRPQLQLDNGFHGENCQYECAVCLNNGQCLNTPHSFYYNYAIESADSLSQPVFLPQTQCICSSSIYDGDAMCCPYGFEPYVYFGKRDVKPYFQYTALPLITNIVNRQMSYWTDEDLWLKTEHSLTYNEPADHQISVSNINKIYVDEPQVVSAPYDTTGPYTKHTFYGTEKDICRACPGLFGKGVRSRSILLKTASEAEDFWWDTAAVGKKCNGVGVCDFYSQKRQADVLFMGEYKTDNKNNKFKLHQRYTSCRDIVNNSTKVVNKVELTECINQTVAIGATAFVYSEPYNFSYDQTKMNKKENSAVKDKLSKPSAQDSNMNRHGYISTVKDGVRQYWSVQDQHIPTPNSNGDYRFHPWDEKDCQIVLPNNTCIMTDKVDYSLYKVGQTGQGDERLVDASFDRFDTCLTYDDGSFKTKIGNYITTTYENGEDPFLGKRCPKGHFCTKTGTGTDTVGYKEACPPGYFQPEWGVTRTTADVHCSRMDTEDTDNCDQNLATLQSDYVDKKCQRCQPNEYAPGGSPACTACPVGRVKKLSGNIEASVLQSMYNIPISLDGAYWYYMEDETGFELSDCALVPNGIVHVPEADQFMTTAEPKFLPVFPCPFSYSSRPGAFVIDGHELVTSLLAQQSNVISAPFANVDTTQGEKYAEVQKEFAKDHCFVCPSSSITGHGSTTCTTCFQDRTAFTTKEIIKSVVEHTPSAFKDVLNDTGMSIPLTSYDHWATNFNHVPNVEEMSSTNHGEGLTVQTFKPISLAELLGYCHYHYPNYIGVLPNIRIQSEPDIFKHTCVSENPQMVSSQKIYMKKEGNWSTQYPLCLGCESGKSNNPLVVGQCTECEPGKYTSTMAEASQIQCKPCPLGTYADQLGQQRCSSCPAGYGQNADGKPSCDGCNPGHYQDQERQSICKPCAAGTWSMTQNSVEVCHSCLIGQRYVTASTPCESCPHPQYMDEAGNTKTTCKVCDPGKQHMGPDKVCQDCGAGKIGTSDKGCEECEPGQYQGQTGQTECTPCGGGHFQTQYGGEECFRCPTGYYAFAYKNVKCTPAGQGKEVTIEGGSQPYTCNDNYFKELLGPQPCEACPAGYKNADGPRTKCEKCLSGQFGGEEKGTSCTLCPEGRYQPDPAQTSCIYCPGPTTTFGKGSTGCSTYCGSGKIVSATPPDNHVRGTCHECRYEKAGEHDCYCKHHDNCFVKGVATLVCMFGICL